MNALYQQLMEDHKNLVRVMNVLEQEINLYDQESTSDESTPDLTLIMDILDYLHYYPESFHHPLEEAAFEYLLRFKSSDPKHIHRIKAEHKALKRHAEKVREHVNAIYAGNPVPIAKLHNVLDTLVKQQLDHIRMEETGVFQAIKQLDASASHEIMGKVDHLVDPLTATNLNMQFDELLKSLKAHP